MTVYKGVDLSEMNGGVDFVELRQAGVQFVILRCGYGSDYPGQQDARFAENVKKAEEAGMPWGAYHYAYAKDADGGKQEAAHALRLLAGRKPALGLWYDLEDASAEEGDLAGATQAFCAAVEAAGVSCGVYANLNWWRNRLTAPVFDRYPRWCAQYNSRCDLEKPYRIWQYTDRLEIGGKRFDGDLFYGDWPAAEQEAGGMTRAEVRALVEELLAAREKERAQKPVSAWAQPAVDYCRAYGLMQGDEDGRFRPQAFITRQEAARLAMNLHAGREG